MSKNNKIFQIAWDCDGVLAESHEPVLKAANKKLSEILNRDINLLKSDLDDFDALTKKALALVNDEKMASEIGQFWFTSEILRSAPPNLAAIEVFKRCQKLPNTTQRVVTTRLSKNAQATKEWLEQYLPDINWQKNLYIRQESDSLSGEDFKISQLENINCMLEDNVATIINIHRKLPQCHVIYFNQPWNSGDQDSYRSQFRLDADNSEAIFQRILDAREKFFEK